MTLEAVNPEKLGFDPVRLARVENAIASDIEQGTLRRGGADRRSSRIGRVFYDAGLCRS